MPSYGAEWAVSLMHRRPAGLQCVETVASEAPAHNILSSSSVHTLHFMLNFERRHVDNLEEICGCVRRIERGDRWVDKLAPTSVPPSPPHVLWRTGHEAWPGLRGALSVWSLAVFELVSPKERDVVHSYVARCFWLLGYRESPCQKKGSGSMWQQVLESFPPQPGHLDFSSCPLGYG